MTLTDQTAIKRIGTLAIWYNLETGLFAKRTKQNHGHIIGSDIIVDSQFRWKEYKQLRKPLRDKIALLNLCELREILPNIGARRPSSVRKGMHLYFLYNETWSK